MIKGVPFSYEMPEVNPGTGTLPIEYQFVQDLPMGLSFDEQSREIMGTPVSALARTAYLYRATDSQGPTQRVAQKTTYITIEEPDPNSVENLVGRTGSLDRSIAARWNAPDNAIDAGVFQYRIEWKRTNVQTWQFGATTTVLEWISGSNLIRNKEYNIRVRAEGTPGNGPWATTRATPYNAPFLDTPSNLHETDQDNDDGAITLNFNYDSSDAQNFVDGFNIQWKGAGQSYSTERQASVSVSSYDLISSGERFYSYRLINLLSGNYAWRIEVIPNDLRHRVSAWLENGDGFSMGGDVAIDGPTNVSILYQSRTTSSFILAWRTAHSAGSDYQLQWKRATQNWSQASSQSIEVQSTAPNPTPIQNTTISGLLSGFTYNVRIRRVRSGNEFSQWVYATESTVGSTPSAPNLGNNVSFNAAEGVTTLISLPAASGSGTISYYASNVPDFISVNHTTRVATINPDIDQDDITFAWNASSSHGVDSIIITINITDAPTGAAPSFPSITPISCTAGEQCAFTFPTASGTPPITYVISPPAWASVAGRGFAGQAPGTPGTFTASISASNSSGTASATVTINVVAGEVDTEPVFAPDSGTHSATRGTSFSYTRPNATGGNAPVTYTVGSVVIPGVVVSTTGLSGTPTATGTYTVVWTATDSDDDDDEFTLTLTVSPPDTEPVFVPDSGTHSATRGTSFSYTRPNATGGNAPVTYTVGSVVIPGVVVSTTGLSGTPTATGTYTVVWTATDDDGDDDDFTLTLTVSPPDTEPVFAPDTGTDNATVGASKTYTRPNATGGNSPVVYTVGSVVIPGMIVSTTGLSGTPTALGEYTVVWTATDSDGDSNTFTLTLTVAAAQIAEPTSLHENSVGETTAQVDWTAPSPSTAVNGYTIRWRRSDVSGAAWSSISITSSATQHTITGLVSGASYDWQVKATTTTDGYTDSDYVDDSDGFTTEQQVAEPTGLHENSVGTTTAQVDWSAPSPFTGVNGYTIRWRRSDVSGAAWSSISITSSATQHTITGLVSGADYDWQVKATTTTSGYLDSDYVDDSDGFTTTIPTVAPPTGLSDTVLGRTSARVNWVAPTNTTGLIGYRVEWKKFTEFAWQAQNLQAATTQLTLTGLDAGSNYNWRVKSRGTTGYDDSAFVSDSFTTQA